MEDTLRVFRMTVTCVSTLLKVLILVLMEDTLRAVKYILLQYAEVVLILVLMEDTLRDNSKISAKDILANVLILVLMEDTLRAYKEGESKVIFVVLILVLMEDTLRGYFRL